MDKLTKEEAIEFQWQILCEKMKLAQENWQCGSAVSANLAPRTEMVLDESEQAYQAYQKSLSDMEEFRTRHGF